MLCCNCYCRNYDFFIIKNSSLVIIGTWYVDSYNTEDGIIKQEDIGEYYGELYQEANSKFTVVFKINGKATLNLPVFEGEQQITECDYEIKGNEIYLTAGGETIKGFEIEDDTLIVYNIYNYDGNVIMKKK
jgi:hypothetical protein